MTRDDRTARRARRVRRIARGIGEWWDTAVVSFKAVTTVIIVLTVAVGALFWRVEDTRQASALAACEASNDFRRFMAGYLASEGDGLDADVTTFPGYRELEPATRTLVDSFVAYAEDEAADARAFALRFRVDFPVLDC